jgi:hypothetical protein
MPKQIVRYVLAARGEAGRSVTRAGLAGLLASVLLGVALLPTSALAARGNGASTKAYIQANYRLVQAAVSRTHPIEAALHGVLSDVRGECPMAAAGSPQDADSEQLSNEVIGALAIAAVALDRSAGRQFASAARGLTWSDPALTRTIHAYVGKVTTLIGLAPPTLCSDVKSWAASAFLALPASTISFAPRFMSAWVAPGELPAALAPYETPEDRQLARRTSRLEERFSELEAREVETWGQIMDTLALWP